ncbi:MAG: hypothetical protein QOE70_6574 [Chthoniobacter sp.]|nr:hypothetical protein [Chthoniobacter sp.]
MQSALRLHGQMMLCGQASATVAWRCLREGLEPRALAAEARRVREVQRELVRGHGGPGVLLWPYHDLPPEHAAFEAANLLSVAGVWQADADSVFFQPEKAVSSEEWSAAVERAPASARETLRQQTPATRAEAVRALLAAVDFTELPLSAQ